MCRKKTTLEFVKEAKILHGDKYDYSLVEYVRCPDKVIIICKNHGEFKQSPSNHLKNKGCKKCYDFKRQESKKERIKRSIKPTKNLTDIFISKAINTHSNDYDHSQVKYVNAKTKVTIKCNKNNHTFQQTPDSHIQGFGCMLCARVKQADSKRIEKDEFIHNADKKHNYKYDYENTNYIQSNKKVQIRCKTHGLFLQTPNAHTAGKGCMKCAILYNSFSKREYIEMSKGRVTSLYLIKC